MTLKKLIKYNKAVFMTGGSFTKGWMITFPMFAAWIIYETLSLPEGWIMSCFAMVVLAGYPIRNYMMVRNYLNGHYPKKKHHMMVKFREYIKSIK